MKTSLGLKIGALGATLHRRFGSTAQTATPAGARRIPRKPPPPRRAKPTRTFPSSSLVGKGHELLGVGGPSTTRVGVPLADLAQSVTVINRELIDQVDPENRSP